MRDGHEAPGVARSVAFALSLSAATAAFVLFLQVGAIDGLHSLDVVRSLLILVSTWWIAWGAAQGILGVTTRATRPRVAQAPSEGNARTVILVPVYNEDPVSTFARIAAMDASLAAEGVRERFDFAILSDTRDEAIALRERLWFQRLVRERGGEGRIFYRRRGENIGRKAGNIEDFVRHSGGAYDFAVILDADSLMEGATLIEMVRRMEAEPDLGLLQTLPRIIGARSRFGRAMQFAAAFHSPVFARGLAMMQGRTGPFWGHNAIVRMRAFAESCGMPRLSGPPPFGGHILSHDYVEAALLARAGWRVRLDDDLDGSYEEGPENIVDHVKRDRRWCQGNLQHSRLLGAPGLMPWSRFVFVQGIMAYIAPLFWLGFLGVSITAVVLAPLPDYFPEEGWPFPVFPGDATSEAVSLFIGIFGLLFLPKLLAAGAMIVRGRAKGFGGWRRALGSTLGELVFSSVMAPVLLAYQTRSVLQVLLGRDGGWPTNNRGDGSLSIGDAWGASGWIAAFGLSGLLATHMLAPDLTPWLVPVGAPMVAAPVITWWSSRLSRSALFETPEERAPSPVIRRHREILADWQGEEARSGVLGPQGIALPA